MHGQQSVGSDVVNQEGLLKSVRTGLRISTRSKPCSDCSVAETNCRECDFHGATAQVLYRHMKQGHLHARPYQCVDCGLTLHMTKRYT